MGTSWSEIERNPYVAYGLTKHEAAGNMTTLLAYYNHDAVRMCSKETTVDYYVWHGDRKLYLVWSKVNEVWRCYIPL